MSREDWTFTYSREEVIEAMKRKIRSEHSLGSDYDTLDRYEEWVRLLESYNNEVPRVGNQFLRLTRDDVNYFGLDQ